MSSTAGTITFDLTALTAELSAAMALRETVNMVCDNVGDYEAADMLAKIVEPTHSTEVASGTFEDAGDTYTGTIDLDSDAMQDVFDHISKLPKKDLKFYLYLYDNDEGSGTPIITQEIYILNNPFTEAMEE